MPNWCHNRLKITGPEPLIRAFVERVRTEEQPLTFAAHVPEPSAEVYAEMEEKQKVTCDLCGGAGKRPVTQAEADDVGARFDGGAPAWAAGQDPTVPLMERPDCNGCRGEGRRVPFSGGWYGWRCANWGTKWDASFDGGRIFIGLSEEAKEAARPSDMAVVVGDHAIYEFDTAWSPPEAWFLRVIEQHPDLGFQLEYGEPGADFAGRVVASGGEVIEDRDVPVGDVLRDDQMWF